MLKNILKNKRGYTIVELVVVMAIIAIIMPLTWGGYNSTRKQNYIKHVANVAQTSIKDTFIDTISTQVAKTGITCNGKSPQINIVKIQLSNPDYPLLRKALCMDNTGNLGNMDFIENIDPSKDINYKQTMEITCSGCDLSGPTGIGYLYIAFTSPYGKYYSFYTSETNASIADSNFKNLNWIKGLDLIYYPTGTTLDRQLEISFDSDTTAQQGIVRKITISKEGNVSLD